MVGAVRRYRLVQVVMVVPGNGGTGGTGGTSATGGTDCMGGTVVRVVWVDGVYC